MRQSAFGLLHVALRVLDQLRQVRLLRLCAALRISHLLLLLRCEQCHLLGRHIDRRAHTRYHRCLALLNVVDRRVGSIKVALRCGLAIGAMLQSTRLQRCQARLLLLCVARVVLQHVVCVRCARVGRLQQSVMEDCCVFELERLSVLLGCTLLLGEPIRLLLAPCPHCLLHLLHERHLHRCDAIVVLCSENAHAFALLLRVLLQVTDVARCQLLELRKDLLLALCELFDASQFARHCRAHLFDPQCGLNSQRVDSVHFRSIKSDTHTHTHRERERERERMCMCVSVQDTTPYLALQHLELAIESLDVLLQIRSIVMNAL
jgi:hypothetical protein